MTRSSATPAAWHTLGGSGCDAEGGVAEQGTGVRVCFVFLSPERSTVGTLGGEGAEPKERAVPGGDGGAKRPHYKLKPYEFDQPLLVSRMTMSQ